MGDGVWMTFCNSFRMHLVLIVQISTRYLDVRRSAHIGKVRSFFGMLMRPTIIIMGLMLESRRGGKLLI